MAPFLRNKFLDIPNICYDNIEVGPSRSELNITLNRDELTHEFGVDKFMVERIGGCIIPLGTHENVLTINFENTTERSPQSLSQLQCRP